MRQKGPLATRTATPTPTAKNNSKYNNCTLECIELGTCTELSLKFELEKTFFGDGYFLNICSET